MFQNMVNPVGGSGGGLDILNWVFVDMVTPSGSSTEISYTIDPTAYNYVIVCGSTGDSADSITISDDDGLHLIARYPQGIPNNQIQIEINGNMIRGYTVNATYPRMRVFRFNK